ncbi:hypothetical protein RFI_25691 [Reticulomyxa filosa]|uniref:Uncharacterized protein n=1 Tax=Reticulomyxa filosa TaxID=46433 RepID=X6MF62_RETFI|nr:hypothetical protein RFI_25691 [Reticulomyxa filosa]|eukprot:ETO11685.1 hypothetical protein RFI_25691 [Reticulomyxa filosa]
MKTIKQTSTKNICIRFVVLCETNVIHRTKILHYFKKHLISIACYLYCYPQEILEKKNARNNCNKNVIHFKSSSFEMTISFLLLSNHKEGTILGEKEERENQCNYKRKIKEMKDHLDKLCQ